jgi:hypothetical protein
MRLEGIAVMALPALIVVLACSNADSPHQADLSIDSLNGNRYDVIVERVANNPDVQFPTDLVREDQYEILHELKSYDITFSEDGEEIHIEPDSIHGHKASNEVDGMTFKLDMGTFAGGQFLVWGNEERVEAELTIYGSGVPIVRSERGYLEQQE